MEGSQSTLRWSTESNPLCRNLLQCDLVDKKQTTGGVGVDRPSKNSKSDPINLLKLTLEIYPSNLGTLFN